MISSTLFVKLSPFSFHFLFVMFDFYMIFAFHCKADRIDVFVNAILYTFS